MEQYSKLVVIPLTPTKKFFTRKTVYALREYGVSFCTRCREFKELTLFRLYTNKGKENVYSHCIECENEVRRINNKKEQNQNKRYEYARTYRRTRGKTPEARAKQREYNKRYSSRKVKINHRGIYLLRMNDVYKIGMSVAVVNRIATLKASLPYASEMIHMIPVNGDLVEAERRLHRHFAHCRLNGEWFALTSDDVAFIMNINDEAALPLNYG